MATHTLPDSTEEAQMIEAVHSVSEALNSKNVPEDCSVSLTQNVEPPTGSQSKFLLEKLKSSLMVDPPRTDPANLNLKVSAKCDFELNFRWLSKEASRYRLPQKTQKN